MQEKTFLMKEGQDFEKHIHHDHDFWKYVKFLAYLTGKDKVAFTGFENIIWNNFTAKLVDWIPSKDSEAQAADFQANETTSPQVTGQSELSGDQTAKLFLAVEGMTSKIEEVTEKVKDLEKTIKSIAGNQTTS
jgi:hypothetical protein